MFQVRLLPNVLCVQDKTLGDKHDQLVAADMWLSLCTPTVNIYNCNSIGCDVKHQYFYLLSLKTENCGNPLPQISSE